MLPNKAGKPPFYTDNPRLLPLETAVRAPLSSQGPAMAIPKEYSSVSTQHYKCISYAYTTQDPILSRFVQSRSGSLDRPSIDTLSMVSVSAFKVIGRLGRETSAGFALPVESHFHFRSEFHSWSYAISQLYTQKTRQVSNVSLSL